MAHIQIVLCPIDFTDLAKQELRLAVEVCEAFGAQLVLHHNLSAVAPGLTRAWEWNELHRGDDVSTAKAEERMRTLLGDIPKTVSATASVTHGPLGTILLELAKQLPADLVVLGSHGWSTPDHASVSERIIDQCPCPVLTVHDADLPARPFRLRPVPGHEPVSVVVPTDFSASGQYAVDYAFGLARKMPLHVHLLHVFAHGTSDRIEAAARTLNDLVPPDLAGQAHCHVEYGEPIDHILRFSERIEAQLIIMGEHARGFLRRFFTRDTAREVLHRACCPVWFVPPAR
jgi:nucleotide-binding universal stress UspA family protein